MLEYGRNLNFFLYWTKNENELLAYENRSTKKNNWQNWEE